MSAWIEEELALLANAESLELFAEAGNPASVELGMVVVGSDLFVRAFRGPSSRWFQLALRSGAGEILVGEWNAATRFERWPDQAAAIEQAYRAKYGSAAALVAEPAARQATLRLTRA